MKAVVREAVIGDDLTQRIGRYLQTDWRLIVAGDDAYDVTDADALIAHRLSADVLAAARRLKLVQCTGAGINGIDACAIPAGAALCNVYEHEVPIAEYVMMGVLMFACGVKQREADLRRGKWTGSGRVFGAFHDEVAASTIGLIGLGRIGREVAKRAKVFGMRVVALRREPVRDPFVDESFGRDGLREFLALCDYIVVSCPLADETRSLIDAAALGHMKPNAVLINPSRAEIVEEWSLYDALSHRRIKGAMMDTWYDYPPSDAMGYGSKYAFHELDNTIMTPHMSAWTEPMVERRMCVVAANLDRLARGEPLLNCIDLASST